MIMGDGGMFRWSLRAAGAGLLLMFAYGNAFSADLHLDLAGSSDSSPVPLSPLTSQTSADAPTLADSSSSSDSDLFPVGGLSELTQAAILENPGLSALQHSLEATEQNDKVARALLLPQLSAGGSRVLQNDNANDNQEEDARELYLSLSQQVFNLPLWDNYASTTKRTDAARARYNGARQSLRVSVVTAWLDLQLANDLTRLTEARIELASAQLSLAQSFSDAGAGTIVDVLDAQARTAGLHADLLQSQYDRRLAQDQLYALSGMHGALSVLDNEAFLQFPPLDPLGEWLARVAQSSPESRAARSELEAADLRVRAAKDVVFPRLALNIRARTEGALNQHQEHISLLLEQSLFSGGGARAEFRRTVSERGTARQTMYEVLRREELQARQLHGRAALAQSRRVALLAAEEAAAAALEATTAGYEGGARIVADVLDAEETLFDARIQLRQTRYNYLRDLAALHALAGAADEEFVNLLDGLFHPAKTDSAQVRYFNDVNVNHVNREHNDV